MSSSSHISFGLSAQRRTRFHFWLALALFVPLTALAISTFVFDSAVIPGLAVFGAFPLIAVLQVMTILKLNAVSKLNGPSAISKLFPWWAPIVFLLFWLSAMSGMFGASDAADEKGGRYVVNEHGIEREVTKAEAIKGNRSQLRLTSSIFGAFSAIGLAVAIGTRKQSGSDVPSPS